MQNLFLVHILQWYQCHTWRLHQDRLYGHLIFRLFPASTQIYKHVHKCLYYLDLFILYSEEQYLMSKIFE